MNREILFRGKLRDGSKWVEGYLDTDKSKKLAFIRTPREVHTDVELIDPSTIGQYTGLKDKNGKRIFEGDIVRCDGYFTAAVEWDGSHARLVLAIVYEGEIDDHVNLTRGKADKLAVIGNIHDNKNLVNGQEVGE